MAKRSKADDLASLVADRIPPIGALPLPYDEPAAAWARLFVITLARLKKAKPGWASITAVQVENFLTTWLFLVQDRTLSKPELDLRIEKALCHLAAHPPWKMKATGRSAEGRTDRWLLMARKFDRPKGLGEKLGTKVAAEAKSAARRSKLSYKKARNPLEAWIDYVDVPPEHQIRKDSPKK
jgi:hypothetical protein